MEKYSNAMHETKHRISCHAKLILKEGRLGAKHVPLGGLESTPQGVYIYIYICIHTHRERHREGYISRIAIILFEQFVRATRTEKGASGPRGSEKVWGLKTR